MEKAVAVSFRTIMHGPYRDHPSEEALERFLMKHSDEDELELTETHILACEACITRLETLELNLRASRMAMQAYLDETISQPSRPPKAIKTGGWLSYPQLTFIGATLAACAAFCVFISVPRDVQMTALRGTETTYVSPWVPLALHLNGRAIPNGEVGIEVVDATGVAIWRGNGMAKDQQIIVEIPRLSSSSAQYFVRIFARADDPGAALLREFSLQTKWFAESNNLEQKQ